MRLLIIGDLHLGRDQSRLEVNTEWETFDALFFVGDLVDINATQITAGEYFLAELAELDVDSYVVPGNHDWQRHEPRVGQFPTIDNIDGGTYVVSDDICLFGQGSAKFDEGPEIRAMKAPSDPEHFRNTVHDLVCDRRVQSDPEGRSDIPVTREEMVEYKRRYRELSRLHKKCNSEFRLLISHAPPYGTPLDRMDSHGPREESRHWGSIALRNFIAKNDLSLVACGHIHESAGTAVIDNTLCVNPGLRNAFEVVLTKKTHHVDNVKLDWS